MSVNFDKLLLNLILPIENADLVQVENAFDSVAAEITIAAFVIVVQNILI